LKTQPVYIYGAGIISPLGSGLAETEKRLRENHSALKPLQIFPLQQGPPLPSGESPCNVTDHSIPRTHLLARTAAAEAMSGQNKPPDAIILGSTTGGILTTEELLYAGKQEKEDYSKHGLHSIASDLAQNLNCTGPVLVISTACSSGTVAITLAKKMLLKGEVKTVLAGGVDSLSRLTYFGFNSLQLVDKNGCKPLDVDRHGMAVSEGAGLLLLSSEPRPGSEMAVLGAGLSCDAYHSATPHPDGEGALAAMEAALNDAGLSPADIDYINLHGTGTPENDLAESKAIRKIFSPQPPLSSVKGATGHTLAAAGAIEAVIATLAVSKNILPANTNLEKLDPALEITPLMAPENVVIDTVLSNSFGFGGNNGSLIIGTAPHTGSQSLKEAPALAIHGFSCLSGAGNLLATTENLKDSGKISGMAENDTISQNLPPRRIRRSKRLPRMTLTLAIDAQASAGDEMPSPHSIFMGTGWGALSETHDFLKRLMDTEEQFSSPIDFVGSVHNAPASQVALMFGSKGANITTSNGDYSFEQALLSAELMLEKESPPALILGADEGHKAYSPLFDSSIDPDTSLSDGGGALYVSRTHQGATCCISLKYSGSSQNKEVIPHLLNTLEENHDKRYALIMVGIPKAWKSEGQHQLQVFLETSGYTSPIAHYRHFTGEFATASALATALAASFFESGSIPGTMTGEEDIPFTAKDEKILILGLGEYVTAMELFRP
jgi:3-oxoacyl-(acyl-carrier-protein) synthase